MLGALMGDFIGSAYEFKPVKTKDFLLVSSRSRFTDDSVLTCAVAMATMNYIDLLLRNNHYTHDEATYKMMVTKYIQSWALVYPHAGYGGKFRRWVESGSSEPYGSFGNGSAMRVSSIGWLFNNIADVELVAKWSAEVTHNTEEGVKAAQAVAGAIFLSRTENINKKNRIKKYISNYGYNLDRTVDSIRPNYKFDATCQGSVPEAIICFLESNSYTDAVKNAVSLGGDADTQAAIAGSIAEAYYSEEYTNIDPEFNFTRGQVINAMDSTMKYVLECFDRYMGKANMPDLKC